MRCDTLDVYVQVGDFIIVSQPTGPNLMGRLIDVSPLSDICVSELSLEDKNYFFLDNGADDEKNCGLLQLFKPVESVRDGYERLSATE